MIPMSKLPLRPERCTRYYIKYRSKTDHINHPLWLFYFDTQWQLIILTWIFTFHSNWQQFFFLPRLAYWHSKSMNVTHYYMIQNPPKWTNDNLYGFELNYYLYVIPNFKFFDVNWKFSTSKIHDSIDKSQCTRIYWWHGYVPLQRPPFSEPIF